MVETLEPVTRQSTGNLRIQALPLFLSSAAPADVASLRFIEMQQAETAGFQNASDYREFVQSGAPDQATFLADRDRIRAAQEARRTCIALRQTETSNLACAEALTADPNDKEVRTAYQNVAQELELALRRAKGKPFRRRRKFSAGQ